MAVTLVGEIVNSADSATGFATGGISGDDDFVEGTGALGVKASNTTATLSTTSLGATAPYDFSVGGGEEGYHLIGWFNTKTPISATGGLRFFMGTNTTNYCHWYVDPTVFYKGGFITKVINVAGTADVANGTYSTGGNPAQLTAVANIGMVFDTTTSIMGSFNNIQIDQFTIGLGARVDAGTGGSPNTWEIVRAADEDTAFWGWWSSTQGAVIGKGKLYIGPETGTATSVFNDEAFSVIFADEIVATGFYEILTRGTNTDVDWALASIASANATNARWSLTVDSTTNTFNDVNGVWSGSDVLTLSANTTLTGTTFIDGTSIVQTSATLDGITVLDANVTASNAYITSNNPALISDSTFTYNAGHAIEITTAGTYSFSGNIFNSYLGTTGTNLTPSSGDNGAAILNSSGGLVTLNIAGGGDSPSIRNTAVSTTQVNNNVTVTVTVQDTATDPIQNAVVAIYRTSDDTEIANELTDVNGEISVSTDGSTDIYVRVRKSTTGSTRYVNVETVGNSGSGLALTVTLLVDEIVDA